MNNLSAERSPIWFEEQLFLKLLVKGTAALYYYEDQNASRLFFSVQDSPIEQLIYKAYTISDSREIGYNVSFRQQILNNLSCGTTSMITINKLQYNSTDLKKYFVKYNRCMGDEVVEVQKRVKKDIFDLTITSGVNFSSFNTTSTNLTKFDNQVSFKAEVDAEVILPFNKGKWRFVFNPTYQYFKDKYTETFPYYKVYTSSIKYSTIQFPIGIRHSFFLSEKNRFFVSGFYVLSPQITIKNEITLSTYTHVEGNKSTGNLAFDLGFSLGKFKLIGCYNSPRDILSNNINYNSDYHSFSVMAGLSYCKNLGSRSFNFEVTAIHKLIFILCVGCGTSYIKGDDLV
jgi:hypothetical protein